MCQKVNLNKEVLSSDGDSEIEGEEETPSQERQEDDQLNASTTRKYCSIQQLFYYRF